VSTTSFASVLADHAARRPERIAVVDDSRRLTYAEVDGFSTSVAAGLAERGVAQGDVVTSRLPNCAEAYVLCAAVNRLGAVHNPLVTIYRERELSFIRGEADPVVWIESAEDEVFVCPPAGSPPPLLDDGDRDARFLLYTSGSTAAPKGVLHSDGTLAAECAAQAEYHRLGADEVFVTPSSVAHISGLLYGVLLPMWLGATSVLMGSWDPERFLALVEREGGTFSGGAPQFLREAVDLAAQRTFDVSSWRVAPVGGADVDPGLVVAAGELGVRSGRGYGSTEFPSITSSSGPDEPDRRRAETEGRPIGTNEIRIVDGEIQARGAELFLGYRDAALDADAFTADGWFRTGDLGVIDAEGCLTVTGRLKDVIIRSGEKISARELEGLLGAHPGVSEVVVVARPDPRTGERACAAVVPRDPGAPPTLAALCAFLLDAGVSTRKLPEQLEIFDALPRTAAGKVDKAALREASP